jgi:hypothetical protein
VIFRPAAALVALACCSEAHATDEAATLAYTCRGYPGFDSGQEIRVAHVRAITGGRAYFYRDDDRACPNAREACRDKAYLVPGDTVLVDRVADGWACVWFAGRTGSTMGFLAEDDLDFVSEDGTLPLEAWVGDWEEIYSAGTKADSPDTVSFTSRDGQLFVTGEATWYGGMNTAGYEIVHTGEIGGFDDDSDLVPAAVHVQGRLAVLDAADEYECAATFRRVGEFLVVEDNSHCGGMNVRFNGAYRRTKPAEEQKR